jgi:DNA-binding response OmpR family regulator
MSVNEKKRILIVDDESSFARLLKINLEHQGRYEVRTESDGNKAFDAALDFCPDLILLDVVMPDVDGGEIAARMKAHRALHSTPIVFVTAAVSREKVDARPQIIGGQVFLAKPVTTEAVIQCIEASLGRNGEGSRSTGTDG